ncbi:hypothetical protein GH733_002582 [Mirounga leonina]|nr:hypothetical protein GH733_002582 [Mirounga leonina]
MKENQITLRILKASEGLSEGYEEGPGIRKKSANTYQISGHKGGQLQSSNRHECISIHVGQAGVQTGNACWELYCLKYGI